MEKADVLDLNMPSQWLNAVESRIYHNFPGVNIFPFAPRYLGAEIRKIKDLGQNFSCLNNVAFEPAAYI